VTKLPRDSFHPSWKTQLEPLLWSRCHSCLSLPSPARSTPFPAFVSKSIERQLFSEAEVAVPALSGVNEAVSHLVKIVFLNCEVSMKCLMYSDSAFSNSSRVLNSRLWARVQSFA